MLSFHVHTNTVSVDMVTDGRADLAIVPFGDIATRSPLLTAETLWQRPWMVVLPCGHPFSGRRSLRLKQIVDYPLVLCSGDNHWRHATDEMFRQAGLIDNLQVAVEVNYTQAARRFVGLGLGISIMPQPRDGVVLPNVVTRPLADPVKPDSVTALWRRGAVESGTARQFVELVKNHQMFPGPTRSDSD